MMAKFLPKLLTVNTFILFGALYSLPASAQWTLSLPPPVQTAAYYAADNIGREIAEDAGRKDRARQGEGSSSYTPPRPKVASTSLTFTPNIPRRKDYFNALLAQYDQAAPGTSAQMRPLLFGENDGDIIQKIQKQVGAQYGLKTNNIADAYAVYWITAWEAANGIFDSPTPPAQMKAVRAQVANILLSVPEIAEDSDINKQAYAENLLTQSVIISSFGGHVKADPANMPKVRAAVLANAKALGVRIETFELTPTGFELAKRK
jgi:hypothetical protein